MSLRGIITLLLALCALQKGHAATFQWTGLCFEWNVDTSAECWVPAGTPGKEDKVVFQQVVLTLDCAGDICHNESTSRSVTYVVARKVLSQASNSTAATPGDVTDSVVETFDGAHSVIRVGSILIDEGSKVVLTSNVFLELNGPDVSVIRGSLVVAANGYPNTSGPNAFSWFMFGGLYGAGNIHVEAGGELSIISGIFAGSYPACSDYYTEAQTKVDGYLQLGGTYGEKHKQRAVGVYINRLIDNYGLLTVKPFEGINENGVIVVGDLIHYGAFWGFTEGYCQARDPDTGDEEWGYMNLNNFREMQFDEDAQLMLHRCGQLVNHQGGILAVARGAYFKYDAYNGQEHSKCNLYPNFWNAGQLIASDTQFHEDVVNDGIIVATNVVFGAGKTIHNSLRGNVIFMASTVEHVINYGRFTFESGSSYLIIFFVNFGAVTVKPTAQVTLAAGDSSYGPGDHCGRQQLPPSIGTSGFIMQSPSDFLCEGTFHGGYFENHGGTVIVDGNSSWFSVWKMINEASATFEIKNYATVGIAVLYNCGSSSIEAGKLANMKLIKIMQNSGTMDVEAASLEHSGVLINTGEMVLSAAQHSSHSNITNMGNLTLNGTQHSSHSNISNMGNLTLSSPGMFTSSGSVTNLGNLTISIKQSAFFENTVVNTGNIYVLEGDAMCHGMFSSIGGSVRVSSPAQLGLMSRHSHYVPGYLGGGYEEFHQPQIKANIDNDIAHSRDVMPQQANEDKTCIAGKTPPDSDAEPAGVYLEDTRIIGAGRLLITSPMKLKGTVAREGGVSHVMMDQLTAMVGGGNLVIEQGTQMLLGVNSTLAGDGMLVIRGDIILDAHVDITIKKKNLIVCETGRLIVNGQLTVGEGSSVNICGGRYEGNGTIIGKLAECKDHMPCSRS